MVYDSCTHLLEDGADQGSIGGVEDLATQQGFQVRPDHRPVVLQDDALVHILARCTWGSQNRQISSC